MSIAILPMSQEFNWNSATVGLIHSSFFWGYLLTQIVGGICADKIGGKLVLGFGVIWWSATTVLTPIAARVRLPFLLVMCAFMGIGELIMWVKQVLVGIVSPMFLLVTAPVFDLCWNIDRIVFVYDFACCSKNLETRNATGLVAPVIAASLDVLTRTLGTLVPMIGASGFATGATATATVIGTVIGSFR